MFKKQGYSIESTIETANGYKTYYRDYDRMGRRYKIFAWILIITLILSILAIILAIGIPFTVMKRQSEQITQLQNDQDNLLERLLHAREKKDLDHDDK